MSTLHALYGTPAKYSDAWYARQLKHAQDCLAEASKVHTPEELAAARAALAVDPRSPQETLFNAPSNAGLITSGQPEPCGLTDALIQGSRRSHENF